ncbi:FGGY-family carbohydrate kinase [Streptomyces sp. FXJ1.4098]|nr:FGGY-family carbohydrate kinase [Streptomyces sp. FXJ1.4098]
MPDPRLGRRHPRVCAGGQHPLLRSHPALARTTAPHRRGRTRRAGRARLRGRPPGPAFGGLAAPWWDNEATGLISGLTFGAGPPELARAALESIAFQVEDVVAGLDTAAGRVTTLLADGGPSDNATLMRLQADTSGRIVRRPRVRDLSALGAAHLAGCALGVFTKGRLAGLARSEDVHRPGRSAEERARRALAWHDAVARARRPGTADREPGSTP